MEDTFHIATGAIQGVGRRPWTFYDSLRLHMFGCPCEGDGARILNPLHRVVPHTIGPVHRTRRPGSPGRGACRPCAISGPLRAYQSRDIAQRIQAVCVARGYVWSKFNTPGACFVTPTTHPPSTLHRKEQCEINHVRADWPAVNRSRCELQHTHAVLGGI